MAQYTNTRFDCLWVIHFLLLWLLLLLTILLGLNLQIIMQCVCTYSLCHLLKKHQTLHFIMFSPLHLGATYGHFQEFTKATADSAVQRPAILWPQNSELCLMCKDCKCLMFQSDDHRSACLVNFMANFFSCVSSSITLNFTNRVTYRQLALFRLLHSFVDFRDFGILGFRDSRI